MSTVGHSSGPPCSLREACTRAGLDRGGERCPDCPVRDLCDSEQRWVVKVAPAVQAPLASRH